MTSSLSKFEEFARLARHDGIDVKPTLLRVLTDFYVQRPSHTPEEEQHFAALALRLVAEVDEQTKATVAQKLLAYGTVPAALLAKLGVALPERTESPASEPSAASAPAPAPARVSDEDRAAAARFSDIFFNANSEERRAILAELDTTATAPPLAIGPADAVTAIQRLEVAALRGRPFEFVLEVERVLAVPRHYAEAIIKDSSGEPMLVMAKALAMPIDVVQRILLLVNPLIGSSVRRVFDLCALYEDVSPQAALRLISLWRHAGAAHSGSHRPAQWPHEVTDPRDTGAADASSPAASADNTRQRAS